MAGIDNLTPWKKGQSGNPNGTTKVARAKALLKEFVAEGMAADIPDDLAERMADLFMRRDPDADRSKVVEFATALAARFRGLKVGQAIAADILVRALSGSTDDLRLIVAMEPNELRMSGQLDYTPHSAEFAPTAKDNALLDSARESGQVH